MMARMNLQKSLPVVTSIAIILVVAVLRDRSKTLATIFATMPINMPLALWVLVSAGPENGDVLATYVRSFIIGLVPAFVWLGVVYVGLKLGWTLLGAIAGGYVIWAILIGGLYGFGILSAPQ
jgi:hypothetical protein